MPTSDQRSAAPAVARLPAAVVTAMRAAFADELATRLPRLRQAARSLDSAVLATALRDVHTLGSSAYLVGASEAGQRARAAEAALLAGDAAGLANFVREVHELDLSLREWSP